MHPLQCNVCRQTFLCTSNRAKLQEHIDGKHSGKNAHTFEVRACALLPFCTVDMPALCALSARQLFRPRVMCWLLRRVSRATRGRTSGWGKLAQTTGRMQLVEGHVYQLR